MRKAMEKADFKSVRGDFKFGTNHIPMQNFYLQDAVKQGDDYGHEDRRARSSTNDQPTSTSASARCRTRSTAFIRS